MLVGICVVSGNDPGEGFGPDALHRYTEHRILTEDEDPFFPDEGMECPDYKYAVEGEEEGMAEDIAFGGDGEEVPSYLMVDEAGWVSNPVYCLELSKLFANEYGFLISG